MSSSKDRLDKWLVQLGLCESRNQAQSLILSGKVRANGVVMDKAGTLLNEEQARTLVLEAPPPFVSRGGLKLQKALSTFGVLPEGRVCLDVGASTGGFTDCLLQQGASHVVAVDVGYGQLDWRLRNDDRVTCLEKTNIRHLTPEQVSGPVSLVVSDVSFISQAKVLPHAALFFAPFPAQSEMIALIKPQFEFKDSFPTAKFDGVVRDPAQHREILIRTLSTILSALQVIHPGWCLGAMTYSPVLGPKGNREFPVYFYRDPQWESGVSAASISLDTLQTGVENIVAESYVANFDPNSNEN